MHDPTANVSPLRRQPRMPSSPDLAHPVRCADVLRFVLNRTTRRERTAVQTLALLPMAAPDNTEPDHTGDNRAARRSPPCSRLPATPPKTSLLATLSDCTTLMH